MTVIYRGGLYREDFSDSDGEAEEEADEDEEEDLKDIDEEETPKTEESTPSKPQIPNKPKILSGKPTQSQKEDPYDALQSECVKALRTLMNTNPGMAAFLSNKDKSVLTITKILDSKNIRTKTQIFFLLATVCRFEDGFWIALDSMNRYKLNRKERFRFQTLVRLLKKKSEITEENVLLKVALVVFINTLINSPQDASLKKQLKKEFVDLKMVEISERLKAQDLDDTLTMQLSIFEEEVQDIEDVDDEEEEVDLDSLEDPMEILKLIRVQLSGSEAFEHFVKILQYFLIISGKSNEKEKSKNMNTLLNMIKKAVSYSEEGGVEEVSVRELQLTDRVETQQRKITQLETRFLKIAEMLKAGKIDEKVLEKIINATSKESKEAFSKSMETMDVNDLQEEFLKDAEDFLVKIKPKTGIDIETSNAPEELKKHLKKLETELKFMTYKCKQLEKQGGSGGSGGSGSGGSGSGGSGGSGSGGSGAGGSGSGNEGEGSSESGNVPTVPSVPSVPTIPTVSEGGEGGSIPLPPGAGVPPPPPGMGIPPPPGAGVPPPPGSGVPPPPGGVPMPPGGVPMPPGGVPGIPQGYVPPKLPQYKSTTQMKGVFWSKVPPQQLKDSVWIKKDIVTGLEGIALDQTELEKLFAKKESIVLETTTKKPEKVTLIDPKKAQNSAIVLGSMRLEHDDIKRAILRMDERVLAPENIKALKDMIPTADERQALNEYQGEFSNLGPAEQFLSKILDIPRMEERLDCWLIKLKFPTNVSAIEPDIESVISSCKQLQQSKKLHQVLQVILAVGNFVNGNKKAVHGFQINALPKLKDTKATGAKINMLDYVVQFLEKNYPDSMNFSEDLKSLQSSERVSIQSITNELNEMRTGVSTVAKEIEKAVDDEYDKFREVMIDFLDYASERVEYFEKQLKEMQTQLEKVQTFFAEDKKKFAPESFFASINVFVTDFKNSHNEILRKREVERKKAEKEQKDRERQQKVVNSRKKKEEEKIEKKKSEQTEDVFVEDAPQEEKGLLDKTLDSLIDGSSFKKPGVSAKKKKQAAASSAINLLQKLEEEKKSTPTSPIGDEQPSLTTPETESAEPVVPKTPRGGVAAQPSKRRLKQGGGNADELL